MTIAPPPAAAVPSAARPAGPGVHIPVMVAEMLAALNPRDGAVYLDATFGGGGYAKAILDHAQCRVWAIDRDPAAIARGATLARQYPGRLRLLHGRFGDMLTLLAEAGQMRGEQTETGPGETNQTGTNQTGTNQTGTNQTGTNQTGTNQTGTGPMGTGPEGTGPMGTDPAGTGPTEIAWTENGPDPTEDSPNNVDASSAAAAALDGIVFDIGVSSFQIDDPARGFSFMADGPLDMRMGQHGPNGTGEASPTAAILVNTLPERDLADLLFQLGEERASRRVARAIVRARAEAPIVTTGRLASIIRAVLPPDKSGHHPATRSFQALRLKVNDELGEIERGLAQAARLLNPGGRIVVVSFHSLEDRIVKRFMAKVSGRAPSPSRHDPGGLAKGPAARVAPGVAPWSDPGAARAGPGRFRLVTPKALRPGVAEIAANPRARSARLRAVEYVGAAV